MKNGVFEFCSEKNNLNKLACKFSAKEWGRRHLHVTGEIFHTVWTQKNASKDYP